MAKKKPTPETKKVEKKEAKLKAAKIKVRFLKSPAAFNLAFYANEIAELPEPLAKELIEVKVATDKIEQNIKK